MNFFAVTICQCCQCCPRHPAGGLAFCLVNGTSQAISANRRGEYFRSYHLLVLSPEQNDSQSEEINVIDESLAEDRPLPVQEAEIRWKKVSLVGR